MLYIPSLVSIYEPLACGPLPASEFPGMTMGSESEFYQPDEIRTAAAMETRRTVPPAGASTNTATARRSGAATSSRSTHWDSGRTSREIPPTIRWSGGQSRRVWTGFRRLTAPTRRRSKRPPRSSATSPTARRRSSGPLPTNSGRPAAASDDVSQPPAFDLTLRQTYIGIFGYTGYICSTKSLRTRYTFDFLRKN